MYRRHAALLWPYLVSTRAETMPATTDPPDKPDGHRPKSRLESEIEEILERAERERPLPPPIPFRPARERRGSTSLLTRRVQRAGSSARRWLVAAPFIAAFLLAIFAQMVSGLSPLLAHIAVSLSVIAFFWPILEHIRNRQTRSSAPTMWRGRDMSDRDEGPTPWEQFRQWLRDRRPRP